MPFGTPLAHMQFFIATVENVLLGGPTQTVIPSQSESVEHELPIFDDPEVQTLLTQLSHGRQSLLVVQLPPGGAPIRVKLFAGTKVPGAVINAPTKSEQPPLANACLFVGSPMAGWKAAKI